MKTFTTSTKTFFTLTIYFCIIHLSNSQIKISGTIEDNNGEPLPFANVLLLQPFDSTLIQGAVSDINGVFNLLNVKSGNYLVNTTMIGYTKDFYPVKVNGENIDIFDIQLNEDTKQLNEVLITAQKPLYEKQADRMVINVQSSTTSAGKTALEVLGKSPGVAVNRQNNSIAMNGKTGVLVMINGKMSRLPIDAVVQMLEGMSSANIEKIELITTPPAKYEAEGNAGIINIVMIENADNGTNGNLGLTSGYNKGEILGGNFNLNHRNNNYNFFFDYSILYDKNKNLWINKRTIRGEKFDRTISSTSHRSPTTTVQNFRSGFEYDLTSKTNAKILVTGYRRNWDMDAITEDVNNLSTDSIITTEMILHESNIWQSLNGSIGISHQLNERQEISFDFDYLYYVNDNPSQYDNAAVINNTQTEELIDVTKDTPIDFMIAKLDYSNQLSEKFSFETGIKSTLSQFKNKVMVQSFIQNQWLMNGLLSNESTLDEKIIAGYVSWDWSPINNIKFNGGLRYEYTESYLSSIEEKGLIDRKFGNFFPTLFISRKFNEESNIHIAYAKRISRPTFNDMAPFVFFVGPNTFVAGNPALKPAITDAIDLSYQLKQWWMSIKYSNTKNNIGFMQPEIDTTNNEQILRSRNLKYLNSWSFSTNLPINITSWWEIQSDVSLYYQTFETNYLESNIKKDILSINLNATSTITLPKEFSIEISGNYQSNSLWGIWQFEPIGQLNIGIRKKLTNDKGTLSLSISDVLYTSVERLKTEIPAFNASTESKYDFNVRSISLTYNRSFGNKKLKSVNINSGSDDERKRVN